MIEFSSSFSFRLFVSCVDENLKVNTLAKSFFYDCFKVCFLFFFRQSNQHEYFGLNIFFTSGLDILILDYLSIKLFNMLEWNIINGYRTGVH